MTDNARPGGHERIETSNFLMIVLILVTIAIGGAVEIVPLFFQRSTTQPVEGLKPYTALQLAGRDGHRGGAVGRPSHRTDDGDERLRQATQRF